MKTAYFLAFALLFSPLAFSESPNNRVDDDRATEASAPSSLLKVEEKDVVSLETPEVKSKSTTLTGIEIRIEGSIRVRFESGDKPCLTRRSTTSINFALNH